MANFDINKAGFAIAALFVVVWAGALACWKFGRLDTRWAPAGLAQVPVPEPGREG
jgi:high-affinity nickel-transport protein